MTTAQDFPGTQRETVTQRDFGAGEDFQQPGQPTEPDVGSAAGIFHQPMADTKPDAVAVDEVPGTQAPVETLGRIGAGEDFHQPVVQSKPILNAAGGVPGTHESIDTQSANGAGEDFPQPIQPAKPNVGSAGGDFIDLRIWAESYWDIQITRVALVHRMKRGGVDADLLEGHRAGLDASENAFRKSMVRSYRRLVRKHMPAVEDWQLANHGVGEHLIARLFGALGHPVHANPYEKMSEAPVGHKCIKGVCGKTHLVALQPFRRTPGQLWAYCGHGEALKRRKGMTQAEARGLGSPRCKTLVRLVAEGTIKVKGAKTHTSDDFDPAVHTCYCDKCGPQPNTPSEPNKVSAGATETSPPMSNPKPNRRAAGENTQPANVSEPIEAAAGSDSGTDPIRRSEPKVHADRYRYRSIYDTRKVLTADRIDDEGKPWTDGHRNADALRIVGKEILRDLWIAAGGDEDG